VASTAHRSSWRKLVTATRSISCHAARGRTRHYGHAPHARCPTSNGREKLHQPTSNVQRGTRVWSERNRAVSPTPPPAGAQTTQKGKSEKLFFHKSTTPRRTRRTRTSRRVCLRGDSPTSSTASSSSRSGGPRRRPTRRPSRRPRTCSSPGAEEKRDTVSTRVRVTCHHSDARALCW
jgi:hypothetical protein